MQKIRNIVVKNPIITFFVLMNNAVANVFSSQFLSVKLARLNNNRTSANYSIPEEKFVKIKHK
jgi:hypothetical protein